MCYAMSMRLVDVQIAFTHFIFHYIRLIYYLNFNDLTLLCTRSVALSLFLSHSDGHYNSRIPLYMLIHTPLWPRMAL